MRRLLLFSTSTVHGGAYLEYGLPFIEEHLDGIATLLFVPYARPSGITHERYTELFRGGIAPLGRKVVGIHETDDATAAVRDAEAVFVGGGNTFVLLRELYARRVIEPLRQRALSGMPYMGSSAGSNVAGRSIGTTNDMPIVYPPSFDALGLVPFNINPHYLDPDPASTHMGETRETRIKEFHAHNPQPVIGLREGALLRIEGSAMTLLGTRGARLFRADQEASEKQPGDDLSALLAEEEIAPSLDTGPTAR